MIHYHMLLEKKNNFPWSTFLSNFGEKNGTNMQNPLMKCTFLQHNPLKKLYNSSEDCYSDLNRKRWPGVLAEYCPRRKKINLTVVVEGSLQGS